MYFVYAIKSVQFNFIYVGMTNDINRRVKQHNNKQNTSTKFYAPFILIHSEKFDTRIEARKREKFLKSGVGKEFLKSLL